MADRAPENRSTNGWPTWAWLLLAALLLALALGAWWWWLKSRGGAAAGDQQARLEAAIARGRQLDTELAGIKPADPADCPPGQVRQPVGGAGAASSPSASASATPLAKLPTTGSASTLGEAALADRLEKATAMVLVVDGNNLGTGTGFFISPNLFVTNRHVVEHSRSTGVMLTSSALGSVRRATVLRTTSGSDVGSPDFALLRLDEGSAPGTLDTAGDISKLAGVVAAGFPGVVVENDPKFRKLLAGDLSMAPDLSLTQGAVQSLQAGPGGMPLIVHTASIAKGNSGGPLVDACGRVVGINTFINVDQSQSAKINYAIRTEAMVSFLQSAGATPRADARPCQRG